MKVRIAFSVANPEDAVPTHFGYATCFRVAELGDDGEVAWSVAQVQPFCGQADRPDNAIDDVVGAIRDCQAVVTVAAGPCARAILSQAGITVLESMNDIDTVIAQMVRRRSARLIQKLQTSNVSLPQLANT